jgi:3-phenylpropionate/trans-cinnamate dioxygenase ferredoxin reductase subunit
VELSNGQRLPADLVVVGIGVQPATGWLQGSGLAVDDGVLVNEFGETSVAGVYAAGDVARAYNPRLGTAVRLEQYSNAHAQGLAVGRSMAGLREAYAPLPGASSEQYGLRLQCYGHLQGGEAVVIRGSQEENAFMAFYLRGGAMVGVFAMNRAREMPTARKLVQAGARPAPELLADEQVPLSQLS